MLPDRRFRGAENCAVPRFRKCLASRFYGLPLCRRALRQTFAPRTQNRVAKEQTIVTGMAGRYATALYELAKENNATEEVSAALKIFRDMANESADLRRLIRSPVIAAEAQVRALDAIFAKAGISGITASFLKLVASKRRLFAIESMIRDFEKLHDADRGVKRAEVTVAHPLSDAHAADLQRTLREITGSKDVEVTTNIDPGIIGGIVVKLGSRMVDGSVRTKLNSIRTRMKEVG
jgi:F-type H+-transporting ATPase subunit delta